MTSTNPSRVAPCRADRWLPSDIEEVIVDAIASGLIDDVTLPEFNDAMRRLTPAEREDYVQTLWDRL